MDLTYVWLIAVSIVGGVLQEALGFGYAVIVMVFFPMFLPSVPAAATVCCLVCLVCSSVMLVQFRKSVRPKTMLWPILAFFLIMPLANYLATRLPQGVMTLALGGFLLVLGGYYLFGSSRIHISGSPTSGLVAGSVSGLFSGLFAVSAPPMALYFLSILEDKAAYMGTFQLFFVVTNLYAMTVRTINGLVTGEVLLWALLSSVGMGAGLLIGNRLCRKADLSVMKTWVYLFIALMGLWTIISYFL